MLPRAVAPLRQATRARWRQQRLGPAQQGPQRRVDAVVWAGKDRAVAQGGIPGGLRLTAQPAGRTISRPDSCGSWCTRRTG
ncbi:hypothetical protein [Lysobacter gummosus]|uniref:hypothetical protein n=1 Tax=Lysobacter gummosus TaxID=262324 RepID=UPI0036388ED3